MRRLLPAAAMAALLCSVGCGDSGADPEPADVGSGAKPAVAAGMRALLDARCVGCHQPGGTGRGDYTLDAEVLQRRSAIGRAVAARTMPPWMPDPSCGSFDGDLSLTNEELALVADWAAGGEPSEPVTPETAALPDPGPPDLSLSAAEAYQPVPEELTDRTVCHPIGPAFATETLIRGIGFKLSRPELAHHLVLFAVPADQVVATPAAGAGAYSCDGMNLIPIAAAIQMAQPYMLPAGIAVPIPAGYRLLLQVHYNIAALPAGDPIPSVTSALDLWLDNAATAQPVDFLSLDANDLRIPAGEANGIAEATKTVTKDTTAYALVPHMHIFGTAFYATVRRADGSEECLISIPNWRFLEQRVFFRPAGDPLVLKAGDEVTIRCEFDNSYQNQPIVRGMRGEPRDLVFGWLSTNEMCQFDMMTVTP